MSHFKYTSSGMVYISSTPWNGVMIHFNYQNLHVSMYFCKVVGSENNQSLTPVSHWGTQYKWSWWYKLNSWPCVAELDLQSSTFD